MKVQVIYAGTETSHKEAVRNFENAYRKILITVCESVMKEQS